MAAPAKPKTRTESDSMGQIDVPAHVYWGAQTQRSLLHFNIGRDTMPPELIRAFGTLKKACALVNQDLGKLSPDKARLIVQSADEVIAGKLDDQFPLRIWQTGSGTQTNMNVNEVIANRAIELAGGELGSKKPIHPNDDVNMSQSTNDAYPTALRLAMIFAADPLIAALDELAYAFKAKAVEFGDVLKIGRTQLQDAVPMTLGQEFDAYFVTIKEDESRIREAAALFREVNLGATAIGTGINTDPRYAALAIEELARISKQPLVPASNLIEATSDMGAFVLFSGVLKRVAVKLSKICNDLRLLSSGPRAGLAEIRLPAVQAGSSIMPGKVNPVIPEVVNQVAFMVIGHDMTVTMCAEGGQLQLNAFEPTIGYCLLSSVRHLTAAITTLTTRCVNDIEADRERCRALVEDSIGLVTALGPTLGYETSSRVAQRALKEKRKVADIVLEEGLLTRPQLDELLKLEAMTAPSRARSGGTG